METSNPPPATTTLKEGQSRITKDKGMVSCLSLYSLPTQLLNLVSQTQPQVLVTLSPHLTAAGWTLALQRKPPSHTQ